MNLCGRRNLQTKINMISLRRDCVSLASSFGKSLKVFNRRNAFHGHEASSLKSFQQIPQQKGFLPAAVDLVRNGGAGYLHEHCDKRHKELGPIFRERLGSAELVFIADTKLIQTVIANEGPRPHHNVPEAWTIYNEVKKVERGLFFQVGEPWFRLRHAFNKVMLADAHKITRFARDILKVNSDLFDLWSQTRDSKSTGDKITVDDIKFELCKWSIEATGLMLFGCRMGCIASKDKQIGESQRADRLVNDVANMFAETSNFQLLPVRLARRLNLATWKRFEAASDNMLKLATEYASEFISKANQAPESRSILKDLIDLDALDHTEITRSMVDLIIAAADTTSNSLQWMLYMLAKESEVQAKLRAEVRALNSDLKALENIKQTCPYLSAFVKEVSRLYPTAPFLARTLDHSIALNGYELPAGIPIVFSLYTTSRMEQYFEDPLAFKPERWLRGDVGGHSQMQTKSHAYATLPFGVGARMCIGRRLAELEMHLLLASFVTRFEASLDGSGDVGVKLKMILCPERPIKLELTPMATL